MENLEKVRKGITYIVDQSETKLKGLGAIEKGVFKPTDPKAFKKHKQQIEFRLKFTQAVEEVLEDHIRLSQAALALIEEIENNNDVEQANLDYLKELASKNT